MIILDLIVILFAIINVLVLLVKLHYKQEIKSAQIVLLGVYTTYLIWRFAL